MWGNNNGAIGLIERTLSNNTAVPDFGSPAQATTSRGQLNQRAIAVAEIIAAIVLYILAAPFFLVGAIGTGFGILATPTPQILFGLASFAVGIPALAAGLGIGLGATGLIQHGFSRWVNQN